MNYKDDNQDNVVADQAQIVVTVSDLNSACFDAIRTLPASDSKFIESRYETDENFTGTLQAAILKLATNLSMAAVMSSDDDFERLIQHDVGLFGDNDIRIVAVKLLDEHINNPDEGLDVDESVYLKRISTMQKTFLSIN